MGLLSWRLNFNRLLLNVGHRMQKSFEKIENRIAYNKSDWRVHIKITYYIQVRLMLCICKSAATVLKIHLNSIMPGSFEWMNAERSNGIAYAMTHSEQPRMHMCARTHANKCTHTYRNAMYKCSYSLLMHIKWVELIPYATDAAQMAHYCITMHVIIFRLDCSMHWLGKISTHYSENCFFSI